MMLRSRSSPIGETMSPIMSHLFMPEYSLLLCGLDDWTCLVSGLLVVEESMAGILMSERTCG